MTDLIARTPLGQTTARSDMIGALTITEVTDRSLASIAQRKDQNLAAGFAKLGLASPPEVRRAVLGDDHAAWWMAPGQWMMDAAFTSSGVWAEQVKEAMGAEASVTDQTEGFCRFDVTGATATALFERLCPLDVNSMDTGSAERTSIHHIGCIVIRDENSWRVLGPNSFAKSLHHALCEVAEAL